MFRKKVINGVTPVPARTKDLVITAIIPTYAHVSKDILDDIVK